MSQENVEIARRSFEAWQNDDYEGWIALHDAAVEYLPSVERRLGRSLYRGHDGASDLWSLWRAEVEGFWIVSDEIRDLGGGRVLHLGKMGFRGSASGMHVDSQLALVITLRDGKIVRSIDFMSHDEALKAVGLDRQAVSEESATPNLVKLVRESAQALARAEVDTFLGFYARDAVVDLTRLGNALRGRTAIGAFLTEWLAGLEELEVAVEEARELGGGVVFAVFHQHGRPVGTSGFLHQRDCWVVIFADGLIERATAYHDIAQAHAAAGRLAEERG